MRKAVNLKTETEAELHKAKIRFLQENDERATDDAVIRAALAAYAGVQNAKAKK